jgi:hypothetical protein
VKDPLGFAVLIGIALVGIALSILLDSGWPALGAIVAWFFYFLPMLIRELRGENPQDWDNDDETD